MINILYRGYNSKEHEWLYGNLIQSYTGNCRIIWEEPFGETPYPDLIERNYEVEINSVGKCLHIKDNSGNFIYEGDYILASKGIGEIFYSVKDAMFKIQWHDGLYKTVRGDEERIFPNHEITLKVIGNNFENKIEEFI